MVLADFLTGTRKRWLKAFKLFKSTKARKNKNRVSPSKCATIDAPADIDVHHCTCASLPPNARSDSSYENASFCSNYFSCSAASGSDDGTRGSDSAFGSLPSSPVKERLPMCYATVTYFNVDSDDSSSINTEYTLLDYEDEDEEIQNALNETKELTSSL